MRDQGKLAASATGWEQAMWRNKQVHHRHKIDFLLHLYQPPGHSLQFIYYNLNDTDSKGHGYRRSESLLKSHHLQISISASRRTNRIATVLAVKNSSNLLFHFDKP